MEQEVPVHSNKKIILLAIGAIGLTFLFLIIAIISVNSSTNNIPESDPSHVVSDPSAKDQKQGTGSLPLDSSESDGWKTYQNSAYSIRYPSDWQHSELSLTGGIKGISLKPVAKLINSSDVILTVTVNDPSVQRIKQSEQTYTKLGFKPSSININNTIASKLSGTIPPRTASMSAEARVINTGYIILNSSGNSYLFDYSYVNSNSDGVLEDTLEKIISSFKLL